MEDRGCPLGGGGGRPKTIIVSPRARTGERMSTCCLIVYSERGEVQVFPVHSYQNVVPMYTCLGGAKPEFKVVKSHLCFSQNVQSDSETDQQESWLTMQQKYDGDKDYVLNMAFPYNASYRVGNNTKVLVAGTVTQQGKLVSMDPTLLKTMFEDVVHDFIQFPNYVVENGKLIVYNQFHLLYDFPT